MSSDRVTFVVHPTDLDRLELTSAAELQWLEAAGPLGYNRYTALITEVDLEKVKVFSALIYYVSLDEETVNLYSEDHFLEMLKLFLELRLGARPEGFQKLAFEELQERRYYPLYRGQYLYLRSEETSLLTLDPLNLLGYYPVAKDVQAWQYVKVKQPIMFEGACIVRSESLNPNQRELIVFTQSALDYQKLTDMVNRPTPSITT